MRKARCNWLIVFIIVTSNIGMFAQAQNDLIVVSTNEQNNETIVTPDPSALRSNWWQFFNVSPSQNKVREEEFIQQLNDIVQNLPMEEQAKNHSLSKTIITNLQARTKFLGLPPLKPEKSATFKAAYNIGEWLELESSYRNKLQEFSDKKLEIENLSDVVDAAIKLYNKELAAYISVDDTDKNKLFHGLNLMVTRSALELAKLRLERNKKELNYRQISLATLLKGTSTASEKITASTNDLPELNNQRQEQIKVLNLAEAHLDTAHSRLVGAVTDTPIAVAQNRLQEQQVIHALVVEGIARLQLGISEGKIALARLLADENSQSEALYKDLKTRQTLIKEIANRQAKWRTDSLREQARAQNMLLSQPSLDATLQKVHEKRNKLTQETLLRLHEINNLRFELESVDKLYKHYLVKQEGVVKHGWYRIIDVIKSTWDSGASWLTASLFNIGETPVTLLGLLRVILILLIAWGVSYMLRRMLNKITERSEGDGSALYTVGQLAHYLILLVGMMIALTSIGLDFTNLALVAGALSVGIGFGLQSIVNNFVSGLILLFERTLKVGDFIELDSGVQGIVMEINVRSTLINTNDNVDIIVPNAELVSAKVTNWTLRDATRRMRIPFGVAYGTDKEIVKKAILEAAEKVPVTLLSPKKYQPQIWLVGFGDSSLDFELVVWVSQAAVKKPGGVTAAYLWQIESSLRKYNIEIPFPQRDLHLRSLFEQDGEEAMGLLRGGASSKREC